MAPGHKMEGSMINGISGAHVRLHGVCQRVQPVFDLAGLLTNRVKRAGVAGGICATGPAKRVLVAEVVARGATDLGHGEG